MSKGSHSLSRKEELARFLEQATFGPTLDAINDFGPLVAVNDGIASWIQDQMDNQEMTLHRKWFREHANHRYEVNHIARPYHACEKNTRYRKYAFSSKGKLSSPIFNLNSVRQDKLFTSKQNRF